MLEDTSKLLQVGFRMPYIKSEQFLGECPASHPYAEELSRSESLEEDPESLIEYKLLDPPALSPCFYTWMGEAETCSPSDLASFGAPIMAEEEYISCIL